MSAYKVSDWCVYVALSCPAALAACDAEFTDLTTEERAVESDELDQLDGEIEGELGLAVGAEDGLTGDSQAYSASGHVYTLPAHGGSGGGPGSLHCAPGSVGVGIYGQSGSYIDQLGLTCASMDSDGSLGPSYDVGALGGSGGGWFRIMCPAGQAIVGVYGASGSYLDRLGLYCSRVNHWMSYGTTQYTTGSAGGSGGWSFADRCPGEYVIAGFDLRTGSYVDQVQPLCLYVNP